MRGVDVTDIAESKRDAGDSNGRGEEACCNGPAEALSPIEEPLSWREVPANLQMHRQGANKD